MAANGTLDGKLEVLIDQVGRLTEGLTEFRSDMTEIKGLIREQLTVAQSQADSIRRISENTQQQAAVAESLAVTVATQAQMIDKLISKL